MRATIALAVLILILLATSVGVLASSEFAKCPASANALPICSVLANANQYDGQEILVRGLYLLVPPGTPHGSILAGADCKTEVNLRDASTFKASKAVLATLRSIDKTNKKGQFKPVDEVLRGVFRVAHEGQCFGQICAGYELEVTELLCVQPAPADAKRNP